MNMNDILLVLMSLGEKRCYINKCEHQKVYVKQENEPVLKVSPSANDWMVNLFYALSKSVNQELPFLFHSFLVNIK